MMHHFSKQKQSLFEMKGDQKALADRLGNLAKATQKSKEKEEKEFVKLLEKIAKKVIKESNANLMVEVEKKCNEFINKAFLDLRLELLSAENVNSARIQQLDSKSSQIQSKVDDMNAEIIKLTEKISKETQTVEQRLKESIEAERAKRINMVKKAQEKNQEHFTTLENSVQVVKTDHTAFIQELKEDFRIQLKENVHMREKLEHMQATYQSKIGNLTRSLVGGSSTVNFNTDSADTLVDHMCQRLQRIEDFIQADQQDNDPIFTPSRATGRQKEKSFNGVVRIRKIEENMLALQERINENEDEIQHVKDKLINSRGNDSSPARGKSPMRGSQLEQSIHYTGDNAHDMRDLERKIKKLAENTTKACKSLSSGLTDVQQATLNLYQWSEKVHNAVELVAEKVQLPSNLCPRARVPTKI